MCDCNYGLCPVCDGPGCAHIHGKICSTDCLIKYADEVGKRERLRVLASAATDALRRVVNMTEEQCIQSITWAMGKQG